MNTNEEQLIKLWSIIRIIILAVILVGVNVRLWMGEYI